MGWEFEPVAVVHSCFAEKFAIPRQPLLAPAATATLELLPPYDQPEALEGLEGVSHLWLLFVFHAAGHGSKHLRVRPPRLGGNQRIGVFASRATHRPNPIGQSVVRLEGIVDGRLLLSGVDLLDGTPILDIKPYVPYADAIGDAHNSLAQAPPAPNVCVCGHGVAAASPRPRCGVAAAVPRQCCDAATVVFQQRFGRLNKLVCKQQHSTLV